MSFKKIVDTIRDAANTVNPTGRFIHGRIVDASREFDGNYSLIVLYPFTVRHPHGEENDSFSSATILIGIWRQDSPDSTDVQREELIASADATCESLVNLLLENKSVAINSIDKEPQYQFYQGTLSGIALRFNLQILSPC